MDGCFGFVERKLFFDNKKIIFALGGSKFGAARKLDVGQIDWTHDPPHLYLKSSLDLVFFVNYCAWALFIYI